MANDVKAGIRLEVENQEGFSRAAEAAAESMGKISSAAEEAARETSELDRAFAEAQAAAAREKDIEDLAVQTAGLAQSMASHAQTVIGLANSFFDATSEVADFGDAIDKQSQQIGMSRRAYQEWYYILAASGGEIKNLKPAYQQLAKVQEGLTKTAADDLEALGLTLEGVQNMSRDELFERVISALQNMTNDSHRAMLAQRLLGSSYKTLQPIINGSAEDIEALRQRFYELGGYMSDEAVDASVAYGDSITDINYKLDSFKRSILVQFMPALTSLRDQVMSDDSLDRLAERIGSAANEMADFVGFIADHGDAVIRTIEGIGAAWATWKGAGIVKTLVGDVTQLYGWLSSLATVLGIGTGAAAAGVGAAGLSVAAVIDRATQLESIGTLGSGHELEEYAANVSTLTAELERLSAVRNDVNQNMYWDTMQEDAYQLLQTSVANATAELEAMRAKAQQTAATSPEVAETAATAATSVVTTAGEMERAVAETAGEIRTDWATGLDGMAETGAQEIVAANEAMAQNMAVISANANVWGTDMMISLANGIRSGAVDFVLPAIDELAGSIEARLHHSEPDVGPLSHDNDWMPDMMRTFAQGIRANAPLVTDAISQAFDFGRSIPQPGTVGAPSISYGGVNVTFQVQDGQNGQQLFEEFSFWLQNQIAREGAVFAQ